jgi:hypothetical protein
MREFEGQKGENAEEFELLHVTRYLRGEAP